MSNTSKPIQFVRFDKCRTICRVMIPAFWLFSGLAAWFVAFAYNTTFHSEYRSDNLIALICSAIIGTSVIASFFDSKNHSPGSPLPSAAWNPIQFFSTLRLGNDLFSFDLPQRKAGTNRVAVNFHCHLVSAINKWHEKHYSRKKPA